MKTLKLIALTTLLFTGIANAKYVEGVHYDTFDRQPTKSNELRGYFSFYCPHCKTMEAYLPDVIKNLPKNIKFKKTHAHVIKNASEDAQYYFALGYEAAASVGWQSPFSAQVFKRIHDATAPMPVNEKRIKEIFLDLGMKQDKVDKLFKSFAVRAKANKHKKLTENTRKHGMLKGVPTFIVNGKYKININKLDRSDFSGELVNITKYLTSKKQ